MPTPASDETLSARLTALSLAVQAIMEHLLLSGTLDALDLSRLREFGFQVLDEMQERGSSQTQVSAARIEEEIRAFWEPLGLPAAMGRIPHAANDRAAREG